MKEKISQLRAISYAYHKRDEERHRALILERDGSLEPFEKSKYKTMLGYIKSWNK